MLPGDCRNVIVPSNEFFREIIDHPLPTDLQSAKALVCAAAALDVFTWLPYRCFIAKGEERVALFGDYGLARQLGSLDYGLSEKVPGKTRAMGAGDSSHVARLPCPDCARREVLGRKSIQCSSSST
jgi:hypothetical protein